MADFTVRRIGTDTSGRPIFVTAYMASWWEAVCQELEFQPTIVQGAFMGRAGGGASASEGYHDGAGCLDLRVWDLTGEQVELTIRTLRRFGAAAWRRDGRHGMDPHIHFVLGTDQPLASGAATQWRQYLDGRDGLAGNGADYEWRPSPLVTTPPAEDPMADHEAQLSAIQADLKGVREDVNTLLQKSRGARERDLRVAQLLRRIKVKVADSADKADIERVLDEISEG